MAEQETTTRFDYDVSWIVSAYLNARILASTASTEGEPGARTQVSLQYLIDELNHSRYTGRALLRYLQDLLTVRAGRCTALALAGRHAALASAAVLPLPAPQTIDGDGRSGGRGGGGGGVIGTRGGCWNERDGEVITNPHTIQRLRILSGENTRGMCWDVALPTLGGIAFYKRWQMGYTCFGDCLRSASHLHPTGAILDEVAAAMTADRATRSASAAPT